MQASDPFDPRAVLGAVKAQPGNAGASRKRGPALTAPARDAIDVLRAGTKERPLARTKELAKLGANDDVNPINSFQLRSARGMRRDGGSVFPAHANTGDPNGPVEACPLMRTHAR